MSIATPRADSNSSVNDSSSLPPWRLSWDALLFVFLWAALYWSSEVGAMMPPSPENNSTLIVNLTRIFSFDPLAAFMLIVLVGYVLVDLMIVGKTGFTLKFVLVWITVIAFVLTPTIVAIQYRHGKGGVLYIHDGAIQTEEAMKFLLSGTNPYATDYTNTPMALWPYGPSGTVNPALYHLPYMPFTFLASVPFYVVFQNTLGWYDQRFVYLGMFLLGLLLILRSARGPREQLAALMVWALNPLFVPFFIEGRNDIIVSFWLIAAIVFVQRKRLGWAGFFIACAAASKQTAWFLIPFFVLYVWKFEREKNLRELARTFAPGVIAFALIVLPFALWNFGAFYEDVINYQSGIAASATLYPIKSLGFGSLALGLHWINAPTDTFPFAWFQIIFGGIVLILLLLRQWRTNTLTQMLMNFALLLLTISFFSRTFNDNHLGFILTWLVLPSFIREPNT